MRPANFIALILFLVALVFVFSLSPRLTRKIQAHFLHIVTPFLKAGSSVEKRAHNFIKEAKKAEELERENELLQTDLDKLRIFASEREKLTKENNELRSALGFQKKAFFDLIPAEIIRRDTTTWWSTVYINKGGEDGIQVGSPVLSDSGLIGKVVGISAHSSIILLLTDEQCKVSAKVEGTKELGILMGQRAGINANQKLKLKFLDKEANLLLGTKVYSSGDGKLFPPGILIGEVKTFTAGDLDGEAEVVPAVDFANLNIVFVMVEQS